MQIGYGFEGSAHGHQVARLGMPGNDPVDQPFQVREVRQHPAQFRAQHAGSGQVLDRIQPPVDRGDIQQGFGDPLADQAFSHRGDGLIQDTQQGTLDLIAAQRLGQFQVAPGGGIQRHEFIQVVGFHAAQQVERGGLVGFAGIGR